MLKAYFTKYTLKFKVPAGTSRGYLYERPSWYLIVQDTHKPTLYGIGDCGLIPGLSIDDAEKIDEKIKWLCDNIHLSLERLRKELVDFPALIFAAETAIWDLENGGKRQVFKSNFSGKTDPAKIPINGLIWMGEPDYMINQIAEKIKGGFKVLKLKVGALDFQKELEVLHHIRSHYHKEELEIRLDANGAFAPEEAIQKLQALSKFYIHSIEQPIQPNQRKTFANIIVNSPISIALDEELIGEHRNADKFKFLRQLKPHYIILKPSLLGGFYHTQEWIKAAEELNISWWITSALESNIGLNAIAQFCSTFENPLPQGLGTGQLYTNNLHSPLTIENGQIFSDPKKRWSIPFKKIAVNQLWLRPIQINGKWYQASDFSSGQTAVEELNPGLVTFLKKWYDGKPYVTFKTSGSTGTPKTICLIKAMMINSANRTISYFKIKKGGNALLCLSAEHIAGAMMVVRSIVGNLNLIISSHFGNPLKNLEEAVEFTAMVPTQIATSLQNQITAQKLLNISKLIIGGAPLDEKYLPILGNSKGRVWTTYGMTETISHVAAAPLRGDELVYHALPEVVLSSNESGRLILSDSAIGVKNLETNDIVELINTKNFVWKARAGEVINRAGYKIYPKDIIEQLKPLIPYPMMVLKFDHPKYFQVPVLALEKKGVKRSDYSKIAHLITQHLSKKIWPAGVHFFNQFPLRENAIKPDPDFIKQHIIESSENTFNFTELIQGLSSDKS